MKHHSFCYILFLLTFSVKGQVPESEFEALKALYRAWNLASHPECNWDTTQNNLTNEYGFWWGITIFDNHVVGVDFDGKNISGYIPVEIGDFPFLTGFDIMDNPNLAGALPSTIENIDSAQHINIYNTGITSIPPEIINCEKMQILKALWCPIESIPPEIANSTNCVTWSFTSCGLTAIPENLKNLNSLSSLQIDENYIEDIPVFNHLDQLWVWDNYLQFDDIEPNIGRINYFYYSPQKPIRITSPQYFCGSEMRLFVEVGGSGNRYRWLKNGVEVQAFSEQAVYVKANPTQADAGTYVVEVTNSLVPGLTLRSEPIEVIIGNRPAPIIRQE